MERRWNVKRSIYWTKEFDSAHFLDLDYESKCLRVHGHTYKVEVWISGDLNKSDMIFDFNHLTEIIKEFDHKILLPSNMTRLEGDYVIATTRTGSEVKINKKECVIVPGNATAEKIAEMIGQKILMFAGDNVKEITVRVWEDPRSYAEVVLYR